MEQEFREQRKLMLQKDISVINTSHMDTMKLIEGADPKFARHMFLRNELIESFAKNMGGGVEILGQPMCDGCERPAAWNTGGTAYCFHCGKTTKEPITVRKYLAEHIKNMPEEILEMLNIEGSEDIEIIK